MSTIAVRALLLAALAGPGLPQTTGVFVPQLSGPGPGALPATAAADLGRGVIVIVGSDFNQQGVTWEYDGGQWRRRNNLFTPYLVPACATPDGNQVLLVGGGAAGFETWDFDGVQWRQRHVGTANNPLSAALTFDWWRGVPVLVACNGAAAPVTTWEWDGSAWALRATGGPPPRDNTRVAFDVLRGVTVLYGGATGPYATSPALDDTWEWDGLAWRLALANGPTPLAWQAMTYDFARLRVWMCGGLANGVPSRSVHEWDGSRWTPVVVSTSVASNGSVNGTNLMAEYAATPRSVVVIAVTSSASTTTWHYRAMPWAAASSAAIGTGCAGPAGVPVLSVTSASGPCIGAPVEGRLQPLPVTFGHPTLLFGGVDAARWNGTSLPLALDPLGFPGCHAYLAPIATTALFDYFGSAAWGITVPGSFDLVGAAFYLQGAVLAPGFNAGGAVFSNALRLVVGTP